MEAAIPAGALTDPFPMSHAHGYVKPTVLRLVFEADVQVSLGQNCKTTTSPNVGTSPCRVTPDVPGQSCNTVGS